MDSKLRLLTVLALTTLAAGTASAQRFPALGGIDVRGSAVQNPADLNRPSAGAGIDLDLGSFGLRPLRPFVGGTWFTTGAPSSAGEGDLEVIGGRAGLRLDVLGAAGISPYLFGAVTGLQVDATVSDSDTQELLSGFNTGATAGGGVVYSIGRGHRVGISAEGSYTWINNLNHWSAGLGLRYRPFGRGAYGRRPAPRVTHVRVEAAPAPVVQVVRADEPRVVPVDGADSVREEIAALRAELARVSEARDAHSADEARGRATAAEAEAMRTAAALASAEARADSLARAAAAAEARADSLARLSDAAAERAAQAEARTGAALLELNRISSATTSFRETERGVVITLGDGLFPAGRTELSPAARAEVARVAFVLGHFRDRVVRIEGHTDDQGAEAANQALSERRGAAVRAAIIAEGIMPERVLAVGYGESRPADSNQNAAGRAHNRRVEVVITAERP